MHPFVTLSNVLVEEKRKIKQKELFSSVVTNIDNMY